MNSGGKVLHCCTAENIKTAMGIVNNGLMRGILTGRWAERPANWSKQARKNCLILVLSLEMAWIAASFAVLTGSVCSSILKSPLTS
jgi:hypothetical protein